MNCESSGLLWEQDRLFPSFQPVESLKVYDLRGAARDLQVAATIIAGIVNRPQPSVYLIFTDDEAFWLQRLPPSIQVTYASATGEEAFYQLLAASYERLHGLIIYDPALPDSMNVATSLAAQHDTVVVSPALADACMQRHAFPVFNDLRHYHWKSRLEAYHWAYLNVLPDASGHIIAGLDPQTFCALRSYLVAVRGFCYWLDSRASLLPRTSRSRARMSERKLLKQLLNSLVPGAVHMGWVIHEQSGVALASHYGIPVVASDYVANLEVWSAISVQVASLEQLRTEHTIAAVVPQLAARGSTVDEQRDTTDDYVVFSSSSAISRPLADTYKAKSSPRVYLSFTMSDGDNLQYCQHHLLHLWQDKARGSVPIGWTLTPLLSQCMPLQVDYYMNTASHNDEFICSPSGLAYMYPSFWPRQRLAHYFAQSASAMEQLGMNTIEIFDIGRIYGKGLPLLRGFSLTGMGVHRHHVMDTVTAVLGVHKVRNVLSGLGYTGRPMRAEAVNDVIVYQNAGYSGTVDHTVRLIKAAALLKQRRPLFLNIYLMAWTMTPSDIKEVMIRLGPDYRCVLPSQLLDLLRKEKQMG